MEYYYYGALVYIGNLNYDRALDFLSIVISVPTQKAISAIQVAAYKNFVLASLIVDGQVRTLPKYTAQGVEKVCRTHASAYLSLVKAFTDTDIQMFHDVASKHSGIFEAVSVDGTASHCALFMLTMSTEQALGIGEAVFTIAASQGHQGADKRIHYSRIERNGRENWRRYSSRTGVDSN